MSETVKLIIEIPSEVYEHIKEYTDNWIDFVFFSLDGKAISAVKNGTPLDSNSDRAEVQAYFDGEAFGWDEGREALTEDLKAEIKSMEYHMIDCEVLVSQEEVLELVEKYKKGNADQKNE